MFKEYLTKSLLAEALTKEIKDFLDSDHKLSDKQEGIQYLGTTFHGRGSSRNYYKFDSPKKIKIDGADTKIEHGVKIPVVSNLDYYHSGELLGKQQTKTETSKDLDKYRTLIKTKDGYQSNDNGVLAPTFLHHKDGKWVEMAHVEPLHKSNYSTSKHHEMDTRFNKVIRHDDFPDITWDKIRSSLKNLEHAKHNNTSVTPEDHHILNNHPVAKNFSDLISNTSISSHDLTPDNIGLWKHPITKKDHVVILDYGGSKKILKDYDDATENYMNKAEKREINESKIYYRVHLNINK